MSLKLPVFILVLSLANQGNSSEGVSNAAEEARKFEQRANELVDQREFEKAFSDYTKALEIEPENVDYRRKRAECCAKIKMYDTAIADYRIVLSSPAHDTSDRVRMAFILHQYGKINEAVDEILLSGSRRDIMILGGILFFERKFQEAIRCYDKGIEDNPQHASAYERRGICYRETGKLDSAIQDFRTSLQINRLNKSLQLVLVETLLEAKRFPEAEQAAEDLEIVDYDDWHGHQYWSKEELNRIVKVFRTIRDEKQRRQAMIEPIASINKIEDNAGQLVTVS